LDTACFERLIRALTTDSTRRTLLGLGGAGLLGALGLDDAAAKKKGKNKKKCKKCGPCKTCKKGRCRPKTDGTVCGSGGQYCQAGACRCPAGQEASGGVCAERPLCLGLGARCTSNGQCCSDICLVDGKEQDCHKFAAGGPCHDDGDCFPDEACIGFVCTG
jgi:hypothetical protein